MDSDSGINFKALVDYFIGEIDAVFDFPLSVLDPKAKSLIEREISSMLSEHHGRE